MTTPVLHVFDTPVHKCLRIYHFLLGVWTTSKIYVYHEQDMRGFVDGSSLRGTVSLYVINTRYSEGTKTFAPKVNGITFTLNMSGTVALVT